MRLRLNQIAQGAILLDIGRFATGYGMGVFSYVVDRCSLIQNCAFMVLVKIFVQCFQICSKVPVFIAEIAPKDLRGALTTLNQVDT